ncbi:PSA-like protein [Mya arenaria]|uniref:Aminopeptidase n=1 Tax=Mya arenaria TaxID=6604 RepID=A0ABY7EN64_MYAAR|nr:PSA-like protein [Mya arenaria]
MTILSQAFNFASRRGILLRKKLLLTIQRTSPFCRAVLGLKSPSVLPSCATSIFPISSVLSISARQISSTMAAKTPFERLPTNVVPVNYDVTLKPSLKSFTFEGSETIQVTVVEPTKAISVNCIEIEVKSVQYQADGGSEITGTIEYKKENEIAVFTFPEQLPAGKGSLKLTFTGELNDRMKGFYRSKYTGPDGEDRYGAVTQFEPVISETDDSSDSSLKVVKYDKTPIMSTYLVAYVVGEYDCVEGKDENGVLVRVYTPVGKKEQGQFALDVAVKTLPFYNKYFNIAYPLPKIDLIAIADFSAAKQWVALVVGHELAHQWFGNLVTMEWWTHLWLNEGFASWIEYLCVDHCFPEFDIWTQFVNQDLGRALDLDALHTSHPIEVPVGSPDEVDEIFDVISYSKGASVIRMLHNYIGDEDFRKGMNSYLTKYAYKNTFTEDLWGSLREASGKPVDKVMTTWTKQMGFPVIKVTESQDGNNRVLKLSQEKFNADGKTVAGESSEWLVPITISTSDSPNTPVKSVLLEGPSMTVTLENVKPGAWVKLNSGSVGMYRVHYTSEMLDALTPAVRDKTLPPRDRLSLENDLFALARAGLASSVDVLKVTEGFINEDNYTVWSDLSLNLSKIAGMLQYTDGYEAYKVYERALFGPVAKSLGWEQREGEGVLKSMLRELALVRLGRYGDPDIVAEARRRFADHCDGKAVLPADLRSPVYVTVLVNGDEDIFNKMLKLYDEADMQEEKDKVRSQDSTFVIAGVTGSVKGREMGWQFVKDNWTEIHKRYTGGFLLARLCKTFFKENTAPGAERSINQALENVHLNAAWMKNQSASVVTFLKDRPAA